MPFKALSGDFKLPQKEDSGFLKIKINVEGCNFVPFLQLLMHMLRKLVQRSSKKEMILACV